MSYVGHIYIYIYQSISLSVDLYEIIMEPFVEDVCFWADDVAERTHRKPVLQPSQATSHRFGTKISFCAHTIYMTLQCNFSFYNNNNNNQNVDLVTALSRFDLKTM